MFYGRTIKVTTAEDLVLLKMAFHRQKDLQDIKGILHVQQGHLDVPYLRHWSAEMLEPPAVRELDELIATNALTADRHRRRVRPAIPTGRRAYQSCDAKGSPQLRVGIPRHREPKQSA